MGEKMAGTNEFAFFRCKSICTGGGPESGRKKFEKCLPAGTGTKIYFSSVRALGCHFRRDDFLFFCFDFLILIAFPPNLQ